MKGNKRFYCVGIFVVIIIIYDGAQRSWDNKNKTQPFLLYCLSKYLFRSKQYNFTNANLKSIVLGLSFSQQNLKKIIKLNSRRHKRKRKEKDGFFNKYFLFFSFFFILFLEEVYVNYYVEFNGKKWRYL